MKDKIRIFIIILFILLLLPSCRKERIKGYPEEPDFSNLLFNFQRDSRFGKMKYKPFWGKGRITITNGWEKKNIKKVFIPQIKGLKTSKSKRHSGFIRINKNIETQFRLLFRIWEKKNLMKYVLNWGGSYCPRKVRGSKYFLSNHAYGTAFDINTYQNPYGRKPASKGKKGCLYKLVPIANELGFYWGGHFKRPDGMHFEAAKVLGKNEIERIIKKYGIIKKWKMNNKL